MKKQQRGRQADSTFSLATYNRSPTPCIASSCGVSANRWTIKGITGYTFRHTIITDVYQETHDANIAAAVAGHSKITITMNRYAHARRNSAIRGIKALDEAYNF